MNQVKILTRSLTEKQLFYKEKTVSAILTGSTKPNSKSVSFEGEVLADEPLCNVASAYRGLDTNYAGQYNE
jgi:hypothetical protein